LNLTAEKAFRSREGKECPIPDLPFLVVSIPSIHQQISHECERYLVKGSFDIIPYVATKAETHSIILEKMDKDCKTPPERRIILATTTVIGLIYTAGLT
jgi:hypothetical protein